MNRTRLTLYLLLLTLLPACQVGPDYEPPELDPPEQFDAVESAVEPAPVDAWWESFDDPVLTACVEEAFAANLDIRASLQRILAARAMRGMEASRYWPQVDAGLAYSVDRLSENNPRFEDAIAAGLFPRDVEYWDTGFDVSWELDLFGGTQRRVEAAVARIEQEEYQRGALMLTVAAEVARNYLELRGHQQRLAVIDEQIANEEARLRVLEVKQRGGLISGTRALQSRARVQQLQALQPSVQAEIRAGQYRLAVLLGRRPEESVPGLDEGRPLPAVAGLVPVGLPSDLLRRRPDVLAAERRLAAATADIGVATAEFFPKFYLTGAPYLQSADFSDLFSSASTAWVYGPRLSWNLFSAGRNQARLDAARAQEEQVFLEYQATVNQVLEEVESSLVRYGNDARSLEFLSRSLELQQQNVELQSLRQRTGIIDSLEVLEARTAWLDARMNRLEQEVLLLTRLVALHKALGGGWPEAETIARIAAEATMETGPDPEQSTE